MENESRKDEGLLTEGKPTIVKGTHSNGTVVMMTQHVIGGKPQVNLVAVPFKGADNPTFDQVSQRAKQDTGCANAQVLSAAVVRMSYEEILENCPAAGGK